MLLAVTVGLFPIKMVKQSIDRRTIACDKKDGDKVTQDPNLEELMVTRCETDTR